MRSKSRISGLSAIIIRIIEAESVVLVPLALFSYALRAEGPLPFLFAWAGLLSALLFGAFGLKKKTATITASLLAALTGISGVLAVLAQVSVAHRSLAEAWLELAREGRAFGFFSFFASEIYALFLIAQCILFIRRRYAMFFAAFFATALLCAGIITGKSALLILAVLCTIGFIITSGGQRDGNPWRQLGLRVQAIVAPVIAAILFSLWFAFNPGISVKTPFPRPDFESLFVSIAPSFPLVRDVPGYGFSTDASNMPSAVFLSGRTLFRVQGERNTVHYLATERYRDWNGQTWSIEPDEGDALPVSRMDRNAPPATGALRLILEEDFTPEIPLDIDTVSVAVTRDAPAKQASFRNRGIRFEPSIRRGCTADLVPGTLTVTPPDETALAGFLGATGIKSERIASLARTLKSRASSNRDYIRVISDYLSDGYEYSLKKGTPSKGDNPVESFLFTDKKGFCLYFASAFVLLAREGGLPARLCEGYRIRLDEYGMGSISGNNAHAWPEVWIDGAWQTFEPTPPYRLSDPFALTGNGDRETRRQLEALFGAPGEARKTEKGPSASGLAKIACAYWWQIGISTGTALALAITLLKLTTTKNRKLRRKAGKLVRNYKRKGVRGPEETGWTVWSLDAQKKAPTAEAAADAQNTANAMIDLTFAPPREEKSS